MAGHDIHSMDPEITMGTFTNVETDEVVRSQVVRIPLTEIFEIPQEMKVVTE